MSINFSDTLLKTKECFELLPIIKKLSAVTIIRDVKGYIRILLEPLKDNKVEEVELQSLRESLARVLGPYFGKDIWFVDGKSDGHQSLVGVIEKERVLAEWDVEEKLPRWYVLERHIAKKSWTSRDSGNQPWEQRLVDQGHKPPIVTFFSFKGGVGRTTGLASTALTLSRNGHRVAMIDLDLEAPGLASLFLPDGQVYMGVVDYLLEKPVQIKDWSLRDHVQNIKLPALGDKDELLRLLPAGTVDENYLEKLARLDMQHLLNTDLVDCLRKMLQELESMYRPLDFILLDARAGFHDIGGLAVADLSHASVIFGRQSRQSWAGITHVIRRLAGSAMKEPLPVLLAHALAPPVGLPGREKELREYRETAYDVFLENYYSGTDVPNESDSDSPHMPIVLPWQDLLRGDLILFAYDEGLDEKERLSGIVNNLTGSDYEVLADRLCRMFGRKLQKDRG